MKEIEARIHTQCVPAFGPGQWIGVILVLNGNDNWHTGLVHRSDLAPEPRLLHLAWHQDLREESLGIMHLWTECALPESRARQVAAMCRLIWRCNARGSIPYALRYSVAAFDSLEGRLRLGTTEHGLTCATFVLAVFRSVGVELLDLGSWSERPEDRDWQMKIVSLLERRGASPEHVTAVRTEVGCARFRPSEVASANASEDVPVPFDLASQLGPALEGIVRKNRLERETSR